MQPKLQFGSGDLLIIFKLKLELQILFLKMKKSYTKKVITKVIILIIFAIFAYAILDIYFIKNEYLVTNNNKNPFVEKTDENKGNGITPIKLPDLPKSAYIDLPFITQSPFASWDALHEDACEEASLLMVKYWLDQRNSVSKTETDNDIKAMVAYEEANGYGVSITLNELNQIAIDYLGIANEEVKKNISIDDIKRELADGNPVIVGAAGKVLENPNFRNGGPNYHMLVIIGYDEKGFITNDPGTRKGEDYRYSFENLFESIHDWNPNNILDGEKNYLVF